MSAMVCLTLWEDAPVVTLPAPPAHRLVDLAGLTTV
jgi:hypothetical protein